MQRAYSLIRGLAVACGLAALCVSASACGDTDDRPATWSYISATILQPNCGTSRCHARGVGTAFGLELDTADADAFTKASYIWMGDIPDQTLLMIRLNGDQGKQRMPVDEPLPQADIDLIRKWIAMGAMNN